MGDLKRNISANTDDKINQAQKEMIRAMLAMQMEFTGLISFLTPGSALLKKKKKSYAWILHFTF